MLRIIAYKHLLQSGYCGFFTTTKRCLSHRGTHTLPHECQTEFILGFYSAQKRINCGYSLSSTLFFPVVGFALVRPCRAVPRRGGGASRWWPGLKQTSRFIELLRTLQIPSTQLVILSVAIQLFIIFVVSFFFSFVCSSCIQISLAAAAFNSCLHMHFSLCDEIVRTPINNIC